MCLLGTFLWFILTFIQRVFWYSNVNFYTGTLRTYNVNSLFLSLSFNCSYERGSYNTVCSCYFVSLQGETYILFYYLSRLNNSPIFKLEKGKPITLAEKNNSSPAPSSESNTDLCRSCRWKTATLLFIRYQSATSISGKTSTEGV